MDPEIPKDLLESKKSCGIYRTVRKRNGGSLRSKAPRSKRDPGGLKVYQYRK